MFCWMVSLETTVGSAVQRQAEFLDGAGVVGGAEAVADPCGVGVTVGQVGMRVSMSFMNVGFEGAKRATDAILAGSFDALAVGDADALAPAAADSGCRGGRLGGVVRLSGWSRLHPGR